MYFEAAAAAVTPDPEVEVGSPKVTVLELVQATDGFGSWCGIYGSTVRQRDIFACDDTNTDAMPKQS